MRSQAVAALEHKIVQKAVLAVLNTIYEEDFLGFSYGIRQKRSQHGALDALVVGDRQHQGELDSRCRPSDPSSTRSARNGWSGSWSIGSATRILRLIRKWLKAGVLEDGVVTVSETGTGQPVSILIGRGLPSSKATLIISRCYLELARHDGIGMVPTRVRKQPQAIPLCNAQKSIA